MPGFWLELRVGGLGWVGLGVGWIRLGCGVAQVGRVRVGMGMGWSWGWVMVCEMCGKYCCKFLLENTWWHFHFFIFL